MGEYLPQLPQGLHKPLYSKGLSVAEDEAEDGGRWGQLPPSSASPIKLHTAFGRAQTTSGNPHESQSLTSIWVHQVAYRQTTLPPGNG